MKFFKSKLIVIRGNSGSGKSSIAKKVRESVSGKTAIVEQDYLRRFILKEKEELGRDNIDLIYRTVVYALSKEYNVILEGILNFSRYGRMLKKLVKVCPNNFFFYLDVSLEETISRHQTKSSRNEFGEKELRSWYKERDLTGFKSEVCISQDHTLDMAVGQIIKKAELG